MSQHMKWAKVDKQNKDMWRVRAAEPAITHYCPSCTQSFRHEADYKAHYKTAHARTK